MEMVFVPRGEFLMGARLGAVPPDNEPMHTHLVRRGYWIARTETTWAQYLEFVRAARAEAPEVPEWLPKDRDEAGRHPVVNVSWEDAQGFCKWANVALPDEGQWEKAARGTDGRCFPWGGQQLREIEPNRANLRDTHCTKEGVLYGMRIEPHWNLPFENDPWVYTSPVGSFPDGASPYGALDMAGNVYEHCQDAYDPDVYGRCQDGVHDVPDGHNHAVRGSTFEHPWMNCQSAMRGSFPRGQRIADTGFRVVVVEEK
jgi:formylglycine-generating enzyme required for sulfatase activity